MRKALLLLTSLALLLCAACEKSTEARDERVILTGVPQYVSADSLVVSLELGADLNPTEVFFMLDGATMLFDYEAPYQWTWRCANYAMGLHTLQARVFFTGGDSKDSAPVEVRRMPFPFRSDYMADWGGITERDENGNLVGEVDPQDWLWHDSAADTKSRQAWFSDFSITSRDREVWLHWNTLCESDNAGFHVWRGAGAEALEDSLAVVISGDTLITGQGDCSTESQYDFQDTHHIEYTTYYYWVEAVDGQGVGTFVGPVAHTVTPWNEDMVNSLYSAYPNPAVNTTTLGFTLVESAPCGHCGG
jgi:hypothetical protein